MLSQGDASDVLRDVLVKTEARLDDHQYEVLKLVFSFPFRLRLHVWLLDDLAATFPLLLT